MRSPLRAAHKAHAIQERSLRIIARSALHGTFAPRAHRRGDAVARAGAAARAGSPSTCADHDRQADAGTSSAPSDPAAQQSAAVGVPIAGSDGLPVTPHGEAHLAGGDAPSLEADAPRPRKPGRWFKWADLLRRVFDFDVLACRSCGGRLRLIATIDDPEVIRRILGHLGLPTTLAPPLPARPPPTELTLPFDFP